MSVADADRRNSDVSAMLAALQKQVDELTNQTRRLQTILRLEDATVVDREMKLTRQRSQGDNIRDLTPREAESISVVFKKFCEPGKELVNLDFLQQVYEKLGEPLTAKEAHRAKTSIRSAVPNHVSLEEFLNFWKLDHARSDRYFERFKLSSAQIKTAAFDLDRIKTRVFGGPKGTLEYRMGFAYEIKDGELKDISPWHDIPLFDDEAKRHVNFVCEIPKWTRAKFEIATGEMLNPIKQDVKNGRLRFYQHGDMMFNYGALPQTWEDPKHNSPDIGRPGDNDPIDAVEVGNRQLKTGGVYVVKIIGVIALIDDGETDWKLFVINVNDPLAPLLNCPEDLEEHLPGAIEAAREYFRVYKVCTGKEPNSFGLDEKCMGPDYAMSILKETHEFWKELRRSNVSGVVSK